MKILIADTSPLISLIVIDKLSLLFSLYKEIFIPEAVWNELNNHVEINKYTAALLTLEPVVRKVNNKIHLPQIDEGEEEAISLYKELNADFLLIDDKKGRQVAEKNMVSCIGTLAILIKAKRENLLTKLKPLFEILLTNNRYYQIEMLNQILLLENEPLF